MIDTKLLKEFTRDMKVLYVEDDEELRKGTAKLLSNFFPVIELAPDGEEGLEKYKNDAFDLVITDIRMPNMDGITMSIAIKQINPEQNIIVTSAHDEAEYLIRLLNEGIDKFVLKPLELERFLHTLYVVCRSIADIKIINDYREKLESTNIRLAQQSEELEEKNRQLEAKIKELTGEENKTIALVEAVENKREVSQEELELLAKVFTSVDAHEFFHSYPTDLMIQNDKLETIEERLDIMINRLNEASPADELSRIGSTFIELAEIIDTIPEFSNIAYALEKLGRSVSELESGALWQVVNQKDLLYTIAESMMKWRENVFVEKSVENIHYLDNALISDCIQIEALLKSEAIDGEDLELF